MYVISTQTNGGIHLQKKGIDMGETNTRVALNRTSVQINSETN